MAGALEALLGLAPRLADLSVSDSLAGAVPGCLLRATSLRRLDLCSNQLSELPAGPVLSGGSSSTASEGVW